MLDKISVIAAKRLCSGLDISSDHFDACRYGVEALLHTVLSTSGLLLIGVCFHRLFETLIIVSVFYINQTLGGGFHATSHIKCFLTMALSLSLSLLFCKLQASQWIFILPCVAALIMLFLNPLILHDNKKYLETRSAFFIKRSCIVTAAWTCIVIFCAVKATTLIPPIAIGVITSAISRITARIQAFTHSPREETCNHAISDND